MIHTKDLMLGNWVQHNIGGSEKWSPSIPMKVVGIYEKDVLLDFDDNEGDVWEIPEEDLLGIEITEEMLDKMFDYDTCEKAFIQDSCRISKMRGKFGNNGFFQIYSGLHHFGYIKYLHQLQNAYHLLTGKDMEVKL